MFSALVGGCNWILFMHGWFCPIRPIHLNGRKSLHFEKKTRLTSLILSTSIPWPLWNIAIVSKRIHFCLQQPSKYLFVIFKEVTTINIFSWVRNSLAFVSAPLFLKLTFLPLHQSYVRIEKVIFVLFSVWNNRCLHIQFYCFTVEQIVNGITLCHQSH